MPFSLYQHHLVPPYILSPSPHIALISIFPQYLVSNNIGPVGPFDHFQGKCHRVCSLPSSVQCSHTHFPSPPGRGQRVSYQGRHRNHPSFHPEAGFYSPYFSVLKKNGSPHPIMDFRALKSPKILHDIPPLYPLTARVPHVDGNIGHSGCVLSPKHPSNVPNAPQIHCGFGSLPVQGSPFWPHLDTKGVHQDHRSHHCLPPSSGHHHFPLHR